MESSDNENKYTFDDLQLVKVPNPEVLDSKNMEICQIMYSEEYIRYMQIFNTLLKMKEYSERSLFVTSKIIDMVPAYYTAWNYRFRILRNLVLVDKSMSNELKIIFLNKELDWIDEFTLSNPKNYQIWSYRQSVLQKLHPKPEFKREVPILQMMLDEDTKNHHVWSYRKWCCVFFQDFSKEWDFTNELIDRDVYNNSAWCHRNFLIENLGSLILDGNSQINEVIDLEIKYTKQKIEVSPHNISPWTYLKFLYEYKDNKSFDTKETETEIDYVRIIEYIKKYSDSTSFALEYLAYFYTKFDAKKYSNEIKTIYNKLIQEYDPIRANYWNYKLEQLEISSTV